jgi:hypothetical protein
MAAQPAAVIAATKAALASIDPVHTPAARDDTAPLTGVMTQALAPVRPTTGVHVRSVHGNVPVTPRQTGVRDLLLREHPPVPTAGRRPSWPVWSPGTGWPRRAAAGILPARPGSTVPPSRRGPPLGVRRVRLRNERPPWRHK